MKLFENKNLEVYYVDSYGEFMSHSEGTSWYPRESEGKFTEYKNGEEIFIIKEKNHTFFLQQFKRFVCDENNNMLDYDEFVVFRPRLFEYLKENLLKKSEEMKDIILQKINDGLMDYQSIADDSVVIIQNPDEIYDINFIIPVRNREDFAKPMFESWKNATEFSDLKITYTVVEHSENPFHSKFCKKNKINYIWVKSNPGEMFNKCLAYNMGAFFSNKAKYLLCHDIDCLVQSDFFGLLQKNIANTEAKAIQCFTGRRVLYCNPQITQEIVGGTCSPDSLDIELPEVSLPHLVGAPGGSILVERDLFFEVGGYDAELFLGNSPEDIFFWDKIDTIDKMHTCDNPPIELYHMYHEPTYYSNPRINEMKATHQVFKNLPESDRRDVIKMKSDLISKFK